MLLKFFIFIYKGEYKTMSNIVDQLLKLDASEIEMPKGTHKM